MKEKQLVGYQENMLQGLLKDMKNWSEYQISNQVGILDSNLSVQAGYRFRTESENLISDKRLDLGIEYIFLTTYNEEVSGQRRCSNSR